MGSAPGTVPRVRRGNRRPAWVRPVVAGVIALALLLLALLALDNADASDVVAALAVSLIVGAVEA